MDAQEHPDVIAEISQRGGQGLAVLATLAEAFARLSAEELRRRDHQERAAARAATHADALAARAAKIRAEEDRTVLAQVMDPDWVAKADLADLGRVWRTARLRETESGFPEAGSAASVVEDRLREMYRRPMDLYDQAVDAGVPRAEAMSAAAEQMARTPASRPHGRRQADSITVGEAPVGQDTFESALAAERDRMTAGVEPQAYRDALERLGAGGEAAARALQEILEARSGQKLGESATAAAVPDDPATLGVDEHDVVGLPGTGRAVGDGDHANAARTAAQLAEEFYPYGMAYGRTVPAHVAAKRPATVAPARTQTKTRIR